MAEYIFSSKLFSGYMRFEYDDDGVISSFENNASLSVEQEAFLHENFPFKHSSLAHIKGKSGNIEEIIDTSFVSFWEKYDNKKGKLQAEAAWKKLDDASKALAISKAKKYRYECKCNGIAMLYPERYLKHRRFDDE